MEVPRLTQTQLAAFAEFIRLAGLDEIRMDMKLQPGDIQLLHNQIIVYCRSEFHLISLLTDILQSSLVVVIAMLMSAFGVTTILYIILVALVTEGGRAQEASAAHVDHT